MTVEINTTSNTQDEYTCVTTQQTAVGKYCRTLSLTASTTQQLTDITTSEYVVVTGWGVSNSVNAERPVSLWFGAEGNNKKVFWVNLAQDGGGYNWNLINTPVRGAADEDLNLESHNGSSTVYATIFFEIRKVRT